MTSRVTSRMSRNDVNKVFALQRRLLSSKEAFLPSLSSERRAQFPTVEAKQLKRGTGGRSSFNGHVVTVFGGGGFLGRYVVNRVAKVGAQLIIPYRGDFYEVQRLKTCGDLGQVLFQPFDLRDRESVFRALKYSNVCVNLIGKESETNRFSFEDVHVLGARTVAHVCRELGISRLVHVSALNASPQPQGHVLRRGSNWLKSKYWGEVAVREEFPLATIIRPADIHGTDDNFSTYFCRWQRRMLGKVPLYRGGFGTFKAPVFVSDVAHAINNAITDDEAPGQTYAAVGPKYYEMRALVEYINRIIQKTPDFDFHVTNLRWSPAFYARALLFSWPTWLHKYPTICLEKLERECVTDHVPEGMKSIEELGVKLTALEDKWETNLMHWRRMGHYGEEVDEFPELEKPPALSREQLAL